MVFLQIAVKDCSAATQENASITHLFVMGMMTAETSVMRRIAVNKTIILILKILID